MIVFIKPDCRIVILNARSETELQFEPVISYAETVSDWLYSLIGDEQIAGGWRTDGCRRRQFVVARGTVSIGAIKKGRPAEQNVSG